MTEPDDIRRHLDRLGLPAEPAVFAPARDPDDEPTSDRPARPGRGPPRPDSPAGEPSPPPDDFPDPPWHEDCQVSLYDDASQLPPNALYFARLNTDGVIIGSAAQLTTATETTGVDGYAALAWNSTRREYFVAWSDRRNASESCGSDMCGTEIYFLRLDAAGARIGTAARLTVAAGESTNPAIADDGTGYGVVWTDERAVPGAPEIYFNSVRCR